MSGGRISERDRSHLPRISAEELLIILDKEISEERRGEQERETDSSVNGFDSVAIVIDIGSTEEISAPRVNICVQIIAIAAAPIRSAKERL